MTHNDLKKGDKVLLSGGRLATICDNRKGICRCIHVEERDGWYGDMGDVYVWEILAKLPDQTDLAEVRVITASTPIDLAPAHAKKQKAIEGVNVRLRHQS